MCYTHSPRGIHAVENTSGDWHSMAQDGLGSVRAEFDANKQFVASQDYAPYGLPFNTIGTFVGSFGYAGEQIDDTGLSYNRARYYNPALGTFTGLDPFEGIFNEPMSLNGYSWVEGNVVNASGRQSDILTPNDFALKVFFAPLRFRIVFLFCFSSAVLHNKPLPRIAL